MYSVYLGPRRAHSRACLRRSIGRSRALAAGATWRLVISSAPWAARAGHTSVIDAAGAIYVIGGFSYANTYFNDVWVSTDGGARPDSVKGGGGGLRAHQGGTKGTIGVLHGSRGTAWGNYGDTTGYYWGTMEILTGTTNGYYGVLRGYFGDTNGYYRGYYRGYSVWGTIGALQGNSGYSRVLDGVLKGHLGGT